MPEIVDLGTGRYARFGSGRYFRILGFGAYTQPGGEPSAPEGVNAADGTGAGLLTWQPPMISPTPVTGYRVQWAPVDSLGVVGAVAGTSPTLGADARGYVITVAAGLWAARVQALNASGWGDQSAWVTFASESGTSTQAAPQAPTQLVVAKQGSVYVATFTPPPAANPAVAGYRYSVEGAAPVEVPAAASSFTVNPTPADGTRTITLVAYNAIGESPAASATFTVAAAPPPSPVSNVAVSPTFNGGVVTWSASPSSVVRYDLEVDGGAQTASVLASEPLRKAFTGLLSGTHQVSVVAVAADGQRSTPVSTSWFITSDTGAVVEYRVVAGSDNRAGFTAAQQSAIGQGKALRVVGGIGRMDGTAYWLDELTDLRFDAGSGFRQFGDPHGTIARIGGNPGPAIAVTGGGARFSNTLTLADASSIAVGDWLFYDADVKYSHKDTWLGMLRQVIGKVGNVIEVDEPFHRERGTAAARVRKMSLARPAVAQGGIIEHADQVNAKGHDLVVMLGCRDTTWDGLEVRNGPGTGLKTAFGYRNTYSNLFSHHLRNSPGQFQFGYGVSDEGDRDTYYELESTEVRHAFTTDQTNQLNTHAGWGVLAGKGECERATVMMDVYDTICTGFNDHEPGWEITYGDVVRNTGTVARGTSATNGVAGATNTNDPTGGFIRSRRARIHASGLVLKDINSHGAQKWYAALTIADLANNMKTQGYTAWAIDDAPTLGPGKLTIGTQGVGGIRCTDALAVAQPVKLENVDIYGPVDNGIDMDAPFGSNTNSQVTGAVRIERAGIGVVESNLLTGASGITFVNCTKNLG